MLLHLPARSVGSRRFLPAGRAESVLQDMVNAVAPVPAGRSVDWTGSDERSGVEVFHHDVYTVVLTGNASRVTAAPDRVEPSRRPACRRESWGVISTSHCRTATSPSATTTSSAAT